MIRKHSFTVMLVCLLMISAAQAFAGSTAVTEQIFADEDIAGFAKRVEKVLADEGAHIAIVSRLGRPANELPQGVEYTHVAFAVYSMIETTDGRHLPGYVYYNLYQDAEKPRTSSLVRDHPVEFFSGSYELKAGIVIPDPELQRRLLHYLRSEDYLQLHNPNYSVIANPYDLRYQNCTEYVLDVVNAAIYQTSDRKLIKNNIRAYYHSKPLAVSTFKLAFGSAFSPDIRLDDHEGPVHTATFSSIRRFLDDYGLANKTLTVYPDSPVSPAFVVKSGPPSG